MKHKPRYVVHWFRNDLRVHDNPALAEAGGLKLPIVGLYILEEEKECVQNVWLHASLKTLQASLKELKIPLLFIQGNAVQAWKQILQYISVSQVTWNRRYEPRGRKHDEEVEKLISRLHIPVIQKNGTVLIEPTELKTSSGDFYKVFTPYWKLHQKLYEIPSRAPCPPSNPSYPSLALLKLEDLQLDKAPIIQLGKTWEPGEKGALKKLKSFIVHKLSHYEKGRDFPAQETHSKLSPHLHFGEISPHAIVRALPPRSQASMAFLRELVFRDFATQLLYHIPALSKEPMKPQFNQWRWDNKRVSFEAWKKGMTGYPIVDAGMRELFTTGFMHNRVRMIVASFLIKDLNIAWQKGVEWFAERLLDADEANNSFNWQWSAGTGPDAQPFFRIFNPVLQSTKFDPQGLYIRRWIPELKKLDNKLIHTPWKASSTMLENACIILGETYPFPSMNHDQAKKAALKEFRRLSY